MRLVPILPPVDTMSGDRIALKEELYTFSPHAAGDFPKQGVSGDIQRAVMPACRPGGGCSRATADTQDKVLATLTSAAHQCRSND
jgi:hypothetical protein